MNNKDITTKEKILISSLKEIFKSIEKTLGHTFKDKGLLLKAIITPSTANEYGLHDWHQETFSTLGDGVLDLIAMENAVEIGLKSKGDITNFKMAKVNNSRVTNIAREHNIQDFILWGKGQLLQQDWNRSHKLLATCVESLLGAAYLDGGLEAVKKIACKIEIIDS